jgi:hypothetical protein
MGNKRVHALRKQLKREQLHVFYGLSSTCLTHPSSTAHVSESQSCVYWNV